MVEAEKAAGFFEFKLIETIGKIKRREMNVKWFAKFLERFRIEKSV